MCIRDRVSNGVSNSDNYNGEIITNNNKVIINEVSDNHNGDNYDRELTCNNLSLIHI